MNSFRNNRGDEEVVDECFPDRRGSRRGRQSISGRINQLVSCYLLLFCIGSLIPGCTKTDEEPNSGPAPPISCPVVDSVNNCGNICRGYPPLPDLGTQLWRGRQGGLYPGGQNTRPQAHTDAGLALAAQIQPLDTTGSPDPIQGKIVFISMGMSNTTMEFAKFIDAFYGLTDRNPDVVPVNCAQGGWEVNNFLDSTISALYWRNIDTLLWSQGLSYQQVQVIWYKQAELDPLSFAPDTSFSGYVAYLKDKFKQSLHILAAKFPNAKLCYLSSRIYSGYSTDNGNPEPFAYYVGWTVKDLIEDQINGDPDLIYEDPGRNSPWLSWGAYLWADGLSPRSDGFVWVCPDDFQEDGRHPSNPIGRIKVATMLLDSLLNDETAVSWLLNTSGN